MSSEAQAGEIPATMEAAAAAWGPLGSLVPFGKNPKIHEASAPELATGIIRLGWGAPILARRESRGIVGGHGRRLAAHLVIERWKTATTRERRAWHPDAIRVATRGEVPIRLLDLDEHDARLMLIADNMIGERLSKTDQERFEEICRDLAGEGVELLGGTGLDDGFVKELLADATAGGSDVTGGDPGPGRYQEQYGVIVVCSNEAEQQRVYEQLRGLGLSCRVVCT